MLDLDFDPSQNSEQKYEPVLNLESLVKGIENVRLEASRIEGNKLKDALEEEVKINAKIGQHLNLQGIYERFDATRIYSRLVGNIIPLHVQIIAEKESYLENNIPFEESDFLRYETAIKLEVSDILANARSINPDFAVIVEDAVKNIDEKYVSKNAGIWPEGIARIVRVKELANLVPDSPPRDHINEEVDKLGKIEAFRSTDKGILRIGANPLANYSGWRHLTEGVSPDQLFVIGEFLDTYRPITNIFDYEITDQDRDDWDNCTARTGTMIRGPFEEDCATRAYSPANGNKKRHSTEIRTASEHVRKSLLRELQTGPQNAVIKEALTNTIPSAYITMVAAYPAQLKLGMAYGNIANVDAGLYEDGKTALPGNLSDSLDYVLKLHVEYMDRNGLDMGIVGAADEAGYWKLPRKRFGLMEGMPKFTPFVPNESVTLDIQNHRYLVTTGHIAKGSAIEVASLIPKGTRTLAMGMRAIQVPY